MMLITVYLQALGGKLLGPNAWNPGYNSIKIAIEVAGTSYNFDYNASGSIDDGNITPFAGARTPYLLPINTPDNTNSGQVDYLALDSNSVCGTLYLNLPANITAMTPATITASIPYPGGNTLITVTQQVVLLPSNAEYSFTLIVPGLLLEPNPTPSGKPSVFVKMMCGCPITVNSYKSFWVPEDFVVTANVTLASGQVIPYNMGFDTFYNDSSFTLDMETGPYTSIYYTAQQLSTGNYGYLYVAGA